MRSGRGTQLGSSRGPAQHWRAQAGRRLSVCVALLIASAALLVGGWFHPANAGSANGITVTKSVAEPPLVGGAVSYTVTVTNDTFSAGALNPDGKAYNLTIVDTLPPQVSFVSTSPSITPSIAYINGN